MRDAEFVLRFFTFKNDLEGFGGGVRLTMDRFMQKNRRPGTPFLTELENSFSTALRKARIVFDEHTFQRWQPEKSEWRKQILAAVYDVQMFGLLSFDEAELLNNKTEIVANFKSLFSDQDFRKSIDAATNTPSYFKERVRRFRNAVDLAIG